MPCRIIHMNKKKSSINEWQILLYNVCVVSGMKKQDCIHGISWQGDALYRQVSFYVILFCVILL